MRAGLGTCAANPIRKDVMTIPTVTLNNDVAMPQLGFGVFQVPNAETAAAVREALQAGYRSIDTARAYDNEEGVGRAIAESGIAREELFVTTKLWNSDHGYDDALRAFDASAARLGLDHVDLYLIHWPTPARDDYVETWRAFEKLLADGRARAIGVSNFQPAHLRRLVDDTGTVPAVNQIELHPYLQQAGLRGIHGDLGIATEAWSPLAKGGDLLGDPTVVELGHKHDRTPAQGRPPLAPAAGHRGDSQVGDAGADPRQHRRVRLRARRRRHRPYVHSGARTAHRAEPGPLRRLTPARHCDRPRHTGHAGSACPVPR
jgi:diketogulonate reductase-like aldo/keto reductase